MPRIRNFTGAVVVLVRHSSAGSRACPEGKRVSLKRRHAMPRPIVRFRAAAFIRQRGRCFYCDYPMWWSNKERYSSHYRVPLGLADQFRCTAEHLRPCRDGGKCSSLNIVAACRICNQRRHARRKELTAEKYKCLVQSRLLQGRWHTYPMPPNGALLSDDRLPPL